MADSMTDRKAPEPHTPLAHAKHPGDVPCGCVTDLKKGGIACRWCGAAYERAEVLEFPAWRCYDCGGSI